jgi:hypothetical protein
MEQKRRCGGRKRKAERREEMRKKGRLEDEKRWRKRREGMARKEDER